MQRDTSNEILRRLRDKGKIVNDSAKEGDVATILQELDIYEAELLAQNEELQEAIANLEQKSEESNFFFQHAPVPYIVTNNVFEIESWNIAAEESFKISKSQTKFFLHLAHKDSIKTLIHFFASNNQKQDSLIAKFYSFDEKDNKTLKSFQIKSHRYFKHGVEHHLLILNDTQKELKCR